jgi:hypothetical protein
VSLVRSGGAHVSACVWQPGRYALTAASGKCAQFDVASMPASFEIAGPWEVEFAPGGGAPRQARFDKLGSWSEQADLGIKYFSGAGTYTRTFSLPAERLGQGQRLFLDLGRVAVMADVQLNGKALGTLWKAPFRVEVTGALRLGENTLAVKVANLWVNRQVGDELLAEDSERNPNGTLKRWPEWLEKSPSPTGRYSFSSWRLWKKDSPLQESGLLGPVTIVSAQEVRAR